MELDGKISILVGSESTRIEIYDKTSVTRFCEITLTPQQLSEALSRTYNVSCESVVIRGVERLGKKHEHKEHIFKIPDTVSYSERKRIASVYAKKTCPEGWIPDGYFDSQNSFFEEDGKKYARCTIRRYVDVDPQKGN